MDRSAALLICDSMQSLAYPSSPSGLAIAPVLRPQNDLSWFLRPFLLAMMTAFNALARLSMEGSKLRFTSSATNTRCLSTSSSERYAPRAANPTVAGSIPRADAANRVSRHALHASARPTTGSRAPFTGSTNVPPLAPISVCVFCRNVSRSASVIADGDDASCTSTQCVGTSGSASCASNRQGGNDAGSCASLLYASAGSSPGTLAITAKTMPTGWSMASWSANCIARSNRAWYASSHGAANVLCAGSAAAAASTSRVPPASSPPRECSPLACAMREGTSDGTPASARARPGASAADHGSSDAAACASMTCPGTLAHSRAS